MKMDSMEFSPPPPLLTVLETWPAVQSKQGCSPELQQAL
jgi:hypothetical protein